MAVDISEYLDAIAGDTEGEEVIEAIRSASLILGTDMYKTADISQLLEEIRTKTFGNEIRMCIHDILERLANATPEGGGSDEPLSLNVMMIQGSYGQYFIPEFTPFGQAEIEE